MPPSDDNDSEHPRRRRPRYGGTHPRKFEQRYKELDPERFPEMQEHIRAQGRTPAGGHVPILVEEVLAVLDPQPGEIVADCTIGHGGHAERFLERIEPAGRLIGLDLDETELQRTARQLGATIMTSDDVEPAGPSKPGPSLCVHLYRSHFAGLGKVLRAEGLDGFDVIFADLGVSSMQIDDPSRGFSYKLDGPLDMRMDVRLHCTAAEVIREFSLAELSAVLADFADEPDHEAIARRIVERRKREAVVRTGQLVDLVLEAKGLTRKAWKQIAADRPGELHPAARTFQALRILVNDELTGLEQFLRAAPYALRPGGRIAVLSFHSGEHERVERALVEGEASGVYDHVQVEPIRPSPKERGSNPRSRSAQLRWGRKKVEC